MESFASARMFGICTRIVSSSSDAVADVSVHSCSGTAPANAATRLRKSCCRDSGSIANSVSRFASLTAWSASATDFSHAS